MPLNNKAIDVFLTMIILHHQKQFFGIQKLPFWWKGDNSKLELISYVTGLDGRASGSHSDHSTQSTETSDIDNDHDCSEHCCTFSCWLFLCSNKAACWLAVVQYNSCRCAFQRWMSRPHTETNRSQDTVAEKEWIARMNSTLTWLTNTTRHLHRWDEQEVTAVMKKTMVTRPHAREYIVAICAYLIVVLIYWVAAVISRFCNPIKPCIFIYSSIAFEQVRQSDYDSQVRPKIW